jgi:hypothetical protein
MDFLLFSSYQVDVYALILMLCFSGSDEQVIIALKSEEVEGLPLSSYFTIFDTNGTVFVDDTKIEGDYKLEGLVFVDWTKEF